MRLPDEFLKCVVFMGHRVVEGNREILKLGGTAFLIGVPAEKLPGSDHFFLVTTRHSILELQGRPYVIRVNTPDGYFKEIGFRGDERWWFHPTEEQAVDVAVIPWDGDESDEDTSFVTTKSFLTDALREDRCVGVGDEIYMVGLFTKLTGQAKNSPIVRTGTIAMTPEEMLPEIRIGKADNDWRGPIEAFLIEARSTGGLSGSPVFVRETIRERGSVKNPASGEIRRDVEMFKCGEWYLLGLVHGHWEIPPDRKNQVEIVTAFKDEPSVNLGIAIVIPAKKILEVLDHPELIAMRKKAEAEHLEKQGPNTQDSAFEKPPSITKEGFEKALKKASRKLRPGETPSQSDQGTPGT